VCHTLARPSDNVPTPIQIGGVETPDTAAEAGRLTVTFDTVPVPDHGVKLAPTAWRLLLLRVLDSRHARYLKADRWHEYARDLEALDLDASETAITRAHKQLIGAGLIETRAAGTGGRATEWRWAPGTRCLKVPASIDWADIPDRNVGAAVRTFGVILETAGAGSTAVLTVAEIAYRSGASKRAIQEALAVLRDDGHLSQQPTGDRSGSIFDIELEPVDIGHRQNRKDRAKTGQSSESCTPYLSLKTLREDPSGEPSASDSVEISKTAPAKRGRGNQQTKRPTPQRLALAAAILDALAISSPAWAKLIDGCSPDPLAAKLDPADLDGIAPASIASAIRRHIDTTARIHVDSIKSPVALIASFVPALDLSKYRTADHGSNDATTGPVIDPVRRAARPVSAADTERAPMGLAAARNALMGNTAL
jgi:hypothetical protein